MGGDHRSRPDAQLHTTCSANTSPPGSSCRALLWADTRLPATFRIVVDSPGLPEPDSEQIAALVGSTIQIRLLYGLLYRRYDNPPTMVELRFFVANALGEDQPQTDHRVRGLRRYLEIEAVRINNGSRYALRGWSATRPSSAGVAISLRRRADCWRRNRGHAKGTKDAAVSWPGLGEAA